MRDGGPEVLRHVPLGSGSSPVATPDCADVLALARAGARAGGDLAAATRAAPVVLHVAALGAPPGWTVDPNEPEVLDTVGPGTLAGKITVPHGGRYEIALEGSFGRAVAVRSTGARSPACATAPTTRPERAARRGDPGRRQAQGADRARRWRPAARLGRLRGGASGACGSRLPARRASSASPRRARGRSAAGRWTGWRSSAEPAQRPRRWPRARAGAAPRAAPARPPGAAASQVCAATNRSRPAPSGGARARRRRAGARRVRERDRVEGASSTGPSRAEHRLGAEAREVDARQPAGQHLLRHSASSSSSTGTARRVASE